MDPVITIVHPFPGIPRPCDLCGVTYTILQVGTRFGRGDGVHLCRGCLPTYRTKLKEAFEAVEAQEAAEKRRRR